LWAVLYAVTTLNSVDVRSYITAQSTAHKPPKDGRKYVPKHVGATSLKCFLMLLSVLSINVN
jgi:hypothetical protein